MSRGHKLDVGYADGSELDLGLIRPDTRYARAEFNYMYDGLDTGEGHSTDLLLEEDDIVIILQEGQNKPGQGLKGMKWSARVQDEVEQLRQAH